MVIKYTNNNDNNNNPEKESGQCEDDNKVGVWVIEYQDATMTIDYE